MPKYSVPYTLQNPKTWYFLLGAIILLVAG